MKYFFKNIPFFKASLALVITAGSCDQVKDDDPAPESIDITMPGVSYGRGNNPVIIPVFGDFNSDEIDVILSSDFATLVETESDDNTFIKYIPQSSELEVIDVQILKMGTVIGSGSVEVRVDSDDCVDTGFSDHYEVSRGSSLHVDLLENDAFCNFVFTGTSGVRETPIQNFEGVQLSVGLGRANLQYTPPRGFTGRVEFIYELCFGFSVGESEDPWEDPIANCEFYYIALATIDVV